jgi:hypothetical protein
VSFSVVGLTWKCPALAVHDHTFGGLMRVTVSGPRHPTGDA